MPVDVAWGTIRTVKMQNRLLNDRNMGSRFHFNESKKIQKKG
jgi:hypothetical protein